MTTLKDRLLEGLESGDIEKSDVLESLLTYLPDDFFDEFVRSDFSYLVPQGNKTSIGFSSQEEEDDYNASHPPTRNYCLECGDDFEWFMHNCDASPYNEEYGCSKCDDYCAFCRD